MKISKIIKEGNETTENELGMAQYSTLCSIVAMAHQGAPKEAIAIVKSKINFIESSLWGMIAMAPELKTNESAQEAFEELKKQVDHTVNQIIKMAQVVSEGAIETND